MSSLALKSRSWAFLPYSAPQEHSKSRDAGSLGQAQPQFDILRGVLAEALVESAHVAQ